MSMKRTSSRDGRVEESPHLNGVAASKSRDCGNSLAALHRSKKAGQFTIQGSTLLRARIEHGRPRVRYVRKIGTRRRASWLWCGAQLTRWKSRAGADRLRWCGLLRVKKLKRPFAGEVGVEPRNPYVSYLRLRSRLAYYPSPGLIHSPQHDLTGCSSLGSNRGLTNGVDQRRYRSHTRQ